MPSSWNCSNSGYGMLGILIEQLSGKRYGEFVQGELLAPLGMTSSGVAHSEVIVPRWPAATRRTAPRCVRRTS